MEESRAMSAKTTLMSLSLIVSVCIGMVLSHKTETTGKGQLVIGLSLDTLKEPRWQADSALFKQRAEALGRLCWCTMRRGMTRIRSRMFRRCSPAGWTCW